jgi:hypothetical protein
MSKRTQVLVDFEGGRYWTVIGDQRVGEPQPGSPEWRAWLDDYGVGSFGFTNEQGTHYTARRERRARGGDCYWYAYRKQDKLLRKVYAGRTQELDLPRLVQVAQLLADQVQGEVEKRAAAPVMKPGEERPGEVQAVMDDITALARACAKDMIRYYVCRGDLVEDLAHGHMGSCSNRYHAQIGGLVHLPEATKPRDIGCWKLAVTRVEEQDCCEIFKLRELYDEVLAERIAIIECANCRQPRTFPGSTLEEVRERFRTATCPRCGGLLFAMTPPSVRDSAAQYLRLVAQALNYRGLMGGGTDMVHVGQGEQSWENFLAAADATGIAQATSQAIHLCRMLGVALPVAPGEEHLTWCATERIRYDGRHDHRQVGKYQDSGGNWWCEDCHDHARLMDYGKQLNYPMIALDTMLTIKQGYQGWLSFAQCAGHRPVFLACRIAALLCENGPVESRECRHQPCLHPVSRQDYLGNGWCERHVYSYTFLRLGVVLGFPQLPAYGVEAGKDAWMHCAVSEKPDRMETLTKQARDLLSQEEWQ